MICARSLSTARRTWIVPQGAGWYGRLIPAEERLRWPRPGERFDLLPAWTAGLDPSRGWRLELPPSRRQAKLAGPSALWGPGPGGPLTPNSSAPAGGTRVGTFGQGVESRFPSGLIGPLGARRKGAKGWASNLNLGAAPCALPPGENGPREYWAAHGIIHTEDERMGVSPNSVRADTRGRDTREKETPFGAPGGGKKRDGMGGGFPPPGAPEEANVWGQGEPGGHREIPYTQFGGPHKGGSTPL